MNEHYPDFDENWPSYVFEHLYQDQGMKKWGGFYLSDHTAVLHQNAQANAEQLQRTLKPQMSSDEITKIINLALVKNLPVQLQLNTLMLQDGEFIMREILTGMISGADNGFYLDGMLIAFDEIYWIQLKNARN